MAIMSRILCLLAGHVTVKVGGFPCVVSCNCQRCGRHIVCEVR